jgi:hypothetical protein
MKFTVAKGARDITELAHHLFEIKGPGAKTREKEIEAALLAANPHLSDTGKIAQGTPIVVPSIDVETPIKESASAAPAVVKLVRNQLDGLRKSLEEGRTREIAQLTQTNKILKTKDFKAVAGKTAAAKKQLAQLTTGTGDRLKELNELKQNQNAGIDQLSGDLDAFITRFF